MKHPCLFYVVRVWNSSTVWSYENLLNIIAFSSCFKNFSSSSTLDYMVYLTTQICRICKMQSLVRLTFLWFCSQLFSVEECDEHCKHKLFSNLVKIVCNLKNCLFSYNANSTLEIIQKLYQLSSEHGNLVCCLL